MKTLFLSLIAICLLAPAAAGATTGTEPCCLTTSDTVKKATAPQLETPDLTLDFMFQDKVYIHIEDANGNTKLSGAFSREELSENEELRQLLRKSRRYLTLDNHYYYHTAE